MYTQNNNNTVSVNFLIHVDSATSAPDESEYDFIFDLKPTARALPFEPFLTLLRLEFESQPRHLENVLAHTSLTKRLQQSLFAWVTNAEYPTIEPTIPVEFQFEQSIIRKALFELIQTAFLRKKLKIRIKNTQYLAASSSELVQEIKSHGSSRLTIDLALEANQFNDWWPQGDTQRQLKHRFLTSGIDCGEISQQTHQISIALDKSSISQHFFWANQLYCGDELYQLVSISSLQDNDETNSLMHVSYSLRAAIFLYQQEDAHRLASRIESANWSSLSSTETAFVFESLYLSKVWFWHYQHAASVASNYVKWAIEFGTEQNVAYSLLLKINTAFLLGKFRYSAIDCRALEEKLLTLKWSYLFGYLTSSYWFDHEHTLDASAQLLSAGRFALQQAIDDENLAAESRSLHYLSIVYLQIGSLNKALHYIDQSIEKSRGLTSHERTYNALNGRAYLLMQMANFDAALTSVERAFSFVVSDGNYEQICTTMCNAALIALFSDHFGNAIKLIDDIFQIMHLRGLNHTRFRSNVELKAIQAVAAFLKGDHRISIAIFKTRKEEDNHTLEGKFFSQLMTIAEYHYEVGTGKTDSRLNELFDTACHTYRHPFMALWILRFQREILKNDYPDQQKIINNKGFEYCQKFNLTSCESWFSEPLGNTDVQRFSARFLKLKALKLTQREAQIDLLKVENNLLKLALDLERYAHNCTDPLTLYDFCLTQLEKIQNIEYAEIRIDRNKQDIYHNKVGLGSQESPLPAHHFKFQYPDSNAVLTIRFSSSTEIFNDALTSWLGRLVDQLTSTSRIILERTKSNDLAYIDYLTGLGNRAAFERFFQQPHNLNCECITVALLDLDNFKVINDRHGHLLGDEILRSFSLHLKNSIRNTDQLYRMGGDEFFLVFIDTPATVVESIIAKQLETFFQRQRKTDDAYRDEWQQLGCSTGLLQINLSSDARLHRDTIIRKADELMYRAKRQQRNGIETAVISF